MRRFYRDNTETISRHNAPYTNNHFVRSFGIFITQCQMNTYRPVLLTFIPYMGRKSVLVKYQQIATVWVCYSTPCIRLNTQQKSRPIIRSVCLFVSNFCSATRTRTGVYGVRGRCPRPLDDSTLLLAPFSKAGAKVLLFFDMRK